MAIHHFISLRLLSILSIALCIASCKKENAVDVDPNYSGEWHSANTFLTAGGNAAEIYFIINESNSVYGFVCDLSCSSCCQLYTTGKASINTSRKKLYIGSGLGKKQVKLDINVAPHLNSDNKWECTINNEVMIRN